MNHVKMVIVSNTFETVLVNIKDGLDALPPARCVFCNNESL